MNACNLAKRLKSLRGLSPFDFISGQWIAEPQCFPHSPDHLAQGTNQLDSTALSERIELRVASEASPFAATSGRVARAVLRK